MVDFVLVSSLLSVVFVALLQVGLALYVRNTLVACAAEGARLGARADSTPAAGVARTRELVAASVSAGFAQRVTATTTRSNGVEVVTVEVVASMPVVGLLGPSGGFHVTGRAFLERQ